MEIPNTMSVCFHQSNNPQRSLSPVAVPAAGRGCVYLLTWPKGGSQWVRDLLTHRLVARQVGVTADKVTFNAADVPYWPTPAGSGVVGPVYAAGPEDWLRNRRAGDRAIVVLRDPRDLVVSLLYSLMLSHRPNHRTAVYRSRLLTLTPEQQLFVVMPRFHRPRAFGDWGELGWGIHGDVLVTSYERLVTDTVQELSAIYAFLGWGLPAGDVQKIVSELSFEQQTGRQRGEEDAFSHLRKGIPGDWRTHFTQLTGFAFEALTDGNLIRSGYEPDPHWYEQLPRTQTGIRDLAAAEALSQVVELQARIVRLEEQNQWLRQQLGHRAA